MIYDVDYKRLAMMLTPLRLRRVRLMNLMYVVMNAVERVAAAFKTGREDITYRVRHNGQVCYLRAALNDLFDTDERRIEIEDAPVRSATIVWRRDVAEDQVILPKTVSLRALSSDETVKFFVVFPEEMRGQTDEERVRAITERYKLVSMRYDIIYR